MPSASRSLKLCATSLAATGLLACAGGQARSGSGGDVRQQATVAELEGQLKAQSAMLSEQQRRIEALELRITSLGSKLTEQAAKPAAERAPISHPIAAPLEGSSGPVPAPEPETRNPSIEYDGGPSRAKRAAKSSKVALAKPAAADSDNEPATIDNGGVTKGRRLRRNPVERAPRLPTGTDLVEPDEGQLARLDQAPEEPRRSSRGGDPAREGAQADLGFAAAVTRLNDGDAAGAQVDLLRFAARHPQHAAADNAIYLAGLAAARTAQCAQALPLFERVWNEYPAGDAVPGAQLEHARCLVQLGRGSEARAALEALEKDHPDVPEASQARSLLNGL